MAEKLADDAGVFDLLNRPRDPEEGLVVLAEALGDELDVGEVAVADRFEAGPMPRRDEVRVVGELPASRVGGDVNTDGAESPPTRGVTKSGGAVDETDPEQEREGEEDSDEALINLATDQAEFSRVVEPFRKQLEFSGNDIIWWPLGKRRQIIVDPRRNFGQPTVVKSGVPATALARSVKANASVDEVARWYEVQRDEVRDAVAFEESLAAAA